MKLGALHRDVEDGICEERHMTVAAMRVEASASSVRMVSEIGLDESESIRPKYSETHRVWDLDGWITMSEAGRRGAAEYGKLSMAQCLEIVRIIRA